MWKRLTFLEFGTTVVAIATLLAVVVMQPVPVPQVVMQPPKVHTDKESRTDKSNREEVTPTNDTPQPEWFQLIAVKIHAEPCGRCKKIAPVITDLQNEFDADPVLFLTFDLTSRDTKRNKRNVPAKRL